VIPFTANGINASDTLINYSESELKSLRFFHYAQAVMLPVKQTEEDSNPSKRQSNPHTTIAAYGAVPLSRFRILQVRGV